MGNWRHVLNNISWIVNDHSEAIGARYDGSYCFFDNKAL